MILILAEKPKAGRRIAEILSGGRFRTERVGRSVMYIFNLGGREYVVVPLRGHVIDVDFPKEFSRWSLKRLRELVRAPIMRKVTAWRTVELLRSLKDRVEAVIVATDADREGEAIGWEVVEYLFRDKPVMRAWFSALTPSEVKRAFRNLMPPKTRLAEAAFTRREVDLLWGAVLTRALSLTSGRRGKEFLSVGRVQTPTLALVVEREREIREFRPKTYYIVSALFGADAPFWGTHPEKFFEKKRAEEIVERVRGKEGRVTEFAKRTVKVPRPAPFDTTTFLSEASRVLGLPPKKALDIAEDLYMSGLISYPRTDNQTYPKDLDFAGILRRLATIRRYERFISEIRPPYRPSRGRKTEDHPPIHPVDVPRETLPPEHARVYDLVVRRFLATLLPEAELMEKWAKIDVDGTVFVAEGKTVLREGWMAVYPVRVEERELPDLREGELLPVLDVKLEKRKTKPPSRYSPGELVKKMESLGLGTKSTRAEIIAKLHRRGYITGKKRIRPTPLGELVYDLLREIAPETLSPAITSRLEEEMERVERGEKERTDVVNASRDILSNLVDVFLRERETIRRRMEGGAQA